MAVSKLPGGVYLSPNGSYHDANGNSISEAVLTLAGILKKKGKSKDVEIQTPEVADAKDDVKVEK